MYFTFLTVYTQDISSILSKILHIETNYLIKYNMQVIEKHSCI